LVGLPKEEVHPPGMAAPRLEAAGVSVSGDRLVRSMSGGTASSASAESALPAQDLLIFLAEPADRDRTLSRLFSCDEQQGRTLASECSRTL